MLLTSIYLSLLGWLRAARRPTNPAARTVDRANGSNRKLGLPSEICDRCRAEEFLVQLNRPQSKPMQRTKGENS